MGRYSEQQIDQRNQGLRTNEGYRSFLSSIGADPAGPLKLSDQQRKQAEAYAQANGLGMDGLQIDPAGNWNQDEGWSKHKKWAIPAAAGVGAIFGGPALLGALGGGGGGTAASAGAAAAGGGGGAAAGGGMGILGTLGKVGGWLGKNAGSLGDVGSVLGGQAKGAADQRMQEGQYDLQRAGLGGQQARDQFASDLALSNAQFGSGMQSAQFGREGMDRQRKAALLTSLLNGLQDANITPGNPAIAARMGQSTGGLRPSAVTGNKEALLALLSAPEIAAPTYQAPTPYRAPGLPEAQEAGGLENILGGAGMATSILGALGGAKRRLPA
jgi:hypothetical protein